MACLASPRTAISRKAVCVLSLVLLLLQLALYVRRGAAFMQLPGDRQTFLSSAVAATAPPRGSSSYTATQAEREAFRALPPQPDDFANHTKECGGQQTDFPRNRILIIHEQHLQSMGCDVRLLRFIKDLLYLNQEVSMLFRGSTPAKMRQPKSKQLASILHINDFEEDQLRKGLRSPPGIYEWTNAERFAQLMAMGYFNVVIIFLWFWYDPQPSVAELVLPLIRAHAPADKQPFVALLCDDAHAIRYSSLRALLHTCHGSHGVSTRHFFSARIPHLTLNMPFFRSLRLGEVEIHPSTRDGYNERARNYMVRQKNMYMLVDMVMHISPMDQVAEKESFPFIKYYKLLRMPIRAFRILNKNMPASMQGRSFLRTAHIGFIGNGMTPTNHLGIQWFLEHCWEVQPQRRLLPLLFRAVLIKAVLRAPQDVRRQLPGVRMRLIGRPPGERMVKGETMPCVKTEDPHCGWAWGTLYSGAEVHACIICLVFDVPLEPSHGVCRLRTASMS